VLGYLVPRDDRARHHADRDNCPTERASLVGPLIESLRPLPARPFCGVDRLTFSFLNRSFVSTAILTRPGYF
jgi:hypothetical protein